MTETITRGGRARALRVMLGLSGTWAAEHADTTRRSVTRWDTGVWPTPAWYLVWLEEIADRTDEYVHHLEEHARQWGSIADVVDHPGLWPTEWALVVTARVMRACPGLEVRDNPDAPPPARPAIPTPSR